MLKMNVVVVEEKKNMRALPRFSKQLLHIPHFTYITVVHSVFQTQYIFKLKWKRSIRKYTNFANIKRKVFASSYYTIKHSWIVNIIFLTFEFYFNLCTSETSFWNTSCYFQITFLIAFIPTSLMWSHLGQIRCSSSGNVNLAQVTSIKVTTDWHVCHLIQSLDFLLY